MMTRDVEESLDVMDQYERRFGLGYKLDDLCRVCGETYGKHYGYECPEQKEGVKE